MVSNQTSLPRPWQASIQARLARVGLDVVEEIDYDSGGRFTRRSHVVGGPGFGAIVVLNDEQLRQLLADLRAELQAAPVGVDLVGLETFTDLIEDALRTEPPSNRFDHASFGAVTRDETRHVLYGHIGLGVDVVGTVRDVDNELSFEQHVVVLPPGAYRPLSPADQASLARALTARPPADALWQQILQDASRQFTDVARRYVQEMYPDLVAAGGRILVVTSPAAAELLPQVDVYSFVIGSKYPLTTPLLARHTILVNTEERAVLLDLDPTAPDAAVAAALGEARVLPPAELGSAAKVAQVVAALVPLDPFWSNPTEGQFGSTAGTGGTIQAVWSGDRFRYEVDFSMDGAVAHLERDDGRVKPL